MVWRPITQRQICIAGVWNNSFSWSKQYPSCHTQNSTLFHTIHWSKFANPVPPYSLTSVRSSHLYNSLGPSYISIIFVNIYLHVKNLYTENEGSHRSYSQRDHQTLFSNSTPSSPLQAFLSWSNITPSFHALGSLLP